MTDLVRGEASESDDEKCCRHTSKAAVYAIQVSGEATESDEEVYEKNFRETSSQILLKNNLLQRKLIESNIALWKCLAAVIKGIVLSTSKQLLNADQILIKSQVSMQAALSSLKIVQSNTKSLHEKTEDIFTANFIPNINKH